MGVSVPEYRPVTVQLKFVTEVFGQEISRFSATMPSIGKIDVQKEYVFVYPSASHGPKKLRYMKFPMEAIKSITYEEICVEEAS